MNNIWLPAIIASSAPAVGDGFDVLALGPSLWFKAAHITGLSNNDPVALWPDSSGNGYDLTQATGSARPLWIASAHGGLPAVRFDGTDDLLERASVPGTISGATEFELWIVMSQPDAGATTSQFHFAWTNSATSDQDISLYAAVANTLYFDHKNYGSGRVSGAQPAGWNTGHHLLVARRDGTTQEIAVDGSVVVSGTNSAGSYNTAATGLIGLGRENALHTGDIAELAAFPRALNSTERADMTNYFQSEYSL